jgi:hypothetical protein
MKLVVQIPCHDEEESPPRTLAVARAHGTDGVVYLPGGDAVTVATLQADCRDA